MSNVGHALSENRSNVIQSFDFSGTQISEKAIKALGLSIIAKVTFNHYNLLIIIILMIINIISLQLLFYY